MSRAAERALGYWLHTPPERLPSRALEALRAESLETLTHDLVHLPKTRLVELAASVRGSLQQSGDGTEEWDRILAQIQEQKPSLGAMLRRLLLPQRP